MSLVFTCCLTCMDLSQACPLLIPGVTFRLSKRVTCSAGGCSLFSPPPRPPPSPAQRLTGDPVGMLSGWGLPNPSSLSIETCCMSSYFLPCSCPLPWPRRVWRWVWGGGREDCGSGGRGLSSCCLAFPQLPNPICMLFTPSPDPLADGTPP